MGLYVIKPWYAKGSGGMTNDDFFYAKCKEAVLSNTYTNVPVYNNRVTITNGGVYYSEENRLYYFYFTATSNMNINVSEATALSAWTVFLLSSVISRSIYGSGDIRLRSTATKNLTTYVDNDAKSIGLLGFRYYDQAGNLNVLSSGDDIEVYGIIGVN